MTMVKELLFSLNFPSTKNLSKEQRKHNKEKLRTHMETTICTSIMARPLHDNTQQYHLGTFLSIVVSVCPAYKMSTYLVSLWGLVSVGELEEVVVQDGKQWGGECRCLECLYRL